MTDARYKQVQAIRAANARFDAQHKDRWAVDGRWVRVGSRPTVAPAPRVYNLDALIAKAVQAERGSHASL